MKSKIGTGLLIFATGFVVAWLLFKKTTEIVEVPIEVPIEIPVVQKEYDTIYPEPEIIKVNNPINKDLQDKLAQANTVIDSLQTYKDFTIKREYREIFDDSTQTINVFAETTGTLDALKVDYKTKPKTIIIDTVLPIKVPRKAKLFFGATALLPRNVDGEGLSPSLKPSVAFLNKKHKNLWTLDVDFVNQSAEIGLLIKF